MKLKVLIPILSFLFLFACSNDNEKIDELSKAESLSVLRNKNVTDFIKDKISYSDDDFYSQSKSVTSIKLNGDSISYEGNGGVVIEENIATIRNSGVYEISGQLKDGQILINSKDKGIVHLILNGVEISSSTSAPIFIKKAEKTVISLAENTENILTDGKDYVYEDTKGDEPNSPLFSKDDLTINGTGTLIINGNYNNGIVCKDHLKITGGNFLITSVDDGIIGRDLVAIKNGSFTIVSGGDGIKSTNDKDEDKGLIAIEDGTFNISAKNDGIQAETNLLIANGSFTIASGGRTPENTGDNNGTPQSSNANDNSATTSDSFKGIKAGVEIAIGDGNFTINSNDDAIHSNKLVTIVGGKFTIEAGDDAIHADSSLLVKGGAINIKKSYEGLESNLITIADGHIVLTSQDDGINISGDKNSNNSLNILGGTIYINAYGDGLDSNGSITMTGGTVIVSGPINDDNGPLDYDGKFEISGGLLIASGSSGMAMAPSDTSSQNSIAMVYPKTQKANTLVHLEDNDGNTIVTFAPEKNFQSVVISSPDIKQNESYILYSGGTSTGTVNNGLYSDGEYKNGSKVVEFTISKVSTWLDKDGESNQ